MVRTMSTGVTRLLRGIRREGWLQGQEHTSAVAGKSGQTEVIVSRDGGRWDTAPVDVEVGVYRHIFGVGTRRAAV